jgi:hypothetical protein
MSSNEVTRTLRTEGTKAFPRSGSFTPRLGSPHVTGDGASESLCAKSATSRYGTSFELSLSASWKKDLR